MNLSKLEGNAFDKETKGILYGSSLGRLLVLILGVYLSDRFYE